MPFFWHHKKKAPANPVDPFDCYADGYIGCDCGHRLALDEVRPLQLIQCPECGASHFVPLRLANFWLFEPIGAGGMGSVYKGCDCESPGQFYAVKVLSREAVQDPANIAALQQEAQTAAAIGDHPHLAKCVAGGVDDGEHYCALEYIDGDRLDLIVDTMHKLAEADVLTMALHILDAEQHIYSHGYLYRDLKPENIIINREGYACLIDYGLCIPLEEAMHPHEEYVSGSPYFLPPERLRGSGEGMYSEIYSLGMVMYYALTGRTFFDADEVEALAKRHLAKFRLSISARLRDFRPELVDLLSTMINQEPENRYQTFAAAIAAVEQVLELTRAAARQKDNET